MIAMLAPQAVLLALQQAPGAGATAGGEGLPTPGVLQHLLDGGPVVLGTLGLLLLLSVLSWILVGVKWLQIRRAGRETERFVAAFDRASNFTDAAVAAEAYPTTPLSAMYRAVRSQLDRQREGSTDSPLLLSTVQRALGRAARDGMAVLEQRLGFLATVASAAPFIGLFGTVWGIMDAFAYIRPDVPILTTVAPHIAQALIATAVGLATAIPAVMAYNYFVGRIRAISVGLDSFADELLNRMSHAYPEQPDAEQVVARIEGRR